MLFFLSIDLFLSLSFSSSKSDEEFNIINQATVPLDLSVLQNSSIVVQTQEEDQSYQSIPTRFDWREHVQVNPVEQQGSCGSCWAFATAATVEILLAYRHGLHGIHLSKQELVDCSSKSYDHTYMNEACQYGYPPEAYRYMLQHGVMEERAYPYNGKPHEVCYTNRLTSASGNRYHIQGYNRLSVGASDQQIQQALYKHGPAVVVIHGTSDIFRNYQ